MGFYIETGTNLGKAEILQTHLGAQIIHQPASFSEVPEDKALICVVNNHGMFEAAGYCFDEREFDCFTDPTDIRPKTWLLMDKAKAEKESGYTR
jgi:hypothetical protein